MQFKTVMFVVDTRVPMNNRTYIIKCYQIIWMMLFHIPRKATISFWSNMSSYNCFGIFVHFAKGHGSDISVCLFVCVVAVILLSWRQMYQTWTMCLIVSKTTATKINLNLQHVQTLHTSSIFDSESLDRKWEDSDGDKTVELETETYELRWDGTPELLHSHR